MKIKPQLAEDANLDAVIFPCGVQPKIDGVRAMNLDGTLTGRSLDPFEGFGITDYFSVPETTGFDGEMTLGDKPNSDERLCSLTTGAMGRFNDVTEMADVHWWLFDYVTPATIKLSYGDRYEALTHEAKALKHPRLHLVPMEIAHNRAELNAIIARFFNEGYEGAIIRNLNAKYKEGRATKKNQELWRVKSWADFEILVTGITEGQVNQNEAKKNTLGRTERSSAKDGMVPNGQVGSIQGTLVSDVHCPITGKLLFKKGLPITAGSGNMTVKEAIDYWQNPHKIVKHFAKIKHMTHGVKDLPRFPTYMSHRLKADMS